MKDLIYKRIEELTVEIEKIDKKVNKLTKEESIYENTYKKIDKLLNEKYKIQFTIGELYALIGRSTDIPEYVITK